MPKKNTWRIAASLLKLLEQVNDRWPLRSKLSDGGIGNAEHASRGSDHNPWFKDAAGVGIVSAYDVTHDPAHGCDSYRLAQALLDSRDPRIKYVISNRRIASGAGGPSAWKWRRYTGKNPHDHHCHVSVTPERFDNNGLWNLDTLSTLPETPVAKQPATLPPLLAKGAKGADVRHLQQLLRVTVDGRFGRATELAVRARQRKASLPEDGRVGPQTWKLLLGIK